MKIRSSVVLVAGAAMLATALGCQCSGGPEKAAAGGDTTSAGATGTAGASDKPTLADASFKLKNGLAVDLVTGPCGDAAGLAVLLGVGHDHDPAGRSGTARLAGRLLAAATTGKAPHTVETGADFTLYSVTTTGDGLTDELDAVAAWMSKAAATDEDLTRERQKLLDALAKLEGEDAPATAASLAEQSVSPARGNGRRAGVKAELEAVTLADLHAFWEAHLRPGNARIVITGRFDATKVRAKIEAAFEPLPAGTPPTVRPPGDTTVKGTLVMGEAPAAIAIAVAAPAPADPLFGAFLLLASRLTEKPAEPRSWSATYEPLLRPDVLFLTAPVKQPEPPEPTAARMRTEAAAVLAAPIAPEDVVKARASYWWLVEPALLDAEMCAADPRAFAVVRARKAQLHADPGPVVDLEKVTKDQLDQASKLFEPKQSTAVIAGGKIR